MRVATVALPRAFSSPVGPSSPLIVPSTLPRPISPPTPFLMLTISTVTPNAQVQRRLLEIAGKDAVQAAILHLLGEDTSALRAKEACAPGAPAGEGSSQAASPRPSADGPNTAPPPNDGANAPGSAAAQFDSFAPGATPCAPPPSGGYCRQGASPNPASSPASWAPFSSQTVAVPPPSAPTMGQLMNQLPRCSTGTVPHPLLPSSNSLPPGALPWAAAMQPPSGAKFPTAPFGSSTVPTDGQPGMGPAGSGGIVRDKELTSELHLALAHAAKCRNDHCAQPFCNSMKLKLCKLDGHVKVCAKPGCLLCKMWHYLQKSNGSLAEQPDARGGGGTGSERGELQRRGPMDPARPGATSMSADYMPIRPPSASSCGQHRRQVVVALRIRS